jgi:hypothetical protein
MASAIIIRMDLPVYQNGIKYVVSVPFLFSLN